VHAGVSIDRTTIAANPIRQRFGRVLNLTIVSSDFQRDAAIFYPEFH
jgi:hypothetical protein